MLDLKLEPCEPPFYAQSGHAQTILGYLLPSPRLQTQGQRLTFPLPDGDVITAQLYSGTSSTAVLVFHGLAGSTESTYMHRTAMLALSMGHTVILFNHRGCGDGAGLARHPYHSGRGEDISDMIAFSRQLLPKHRLISVGFSMSGNASLCLLTGLRGSVLPDAAVVVNAPIDLAKCSELLGQGLNRVYDAKFYAQCRRDVLANLSGNEYRSIIPAVGTLARLDDLYTAPAGGFADRHDYYEQCSTYDYFDRIQVPTVVLTAADDPFVPVSVYRKTKASGNVHLHIESRGGHMGYLHKRQTPLGSIRWQDYALDQIIRNI